MKYTKEYRQQISCMIATVQFPVSFLPGIRFNYSSCDAHHFWKNFKCGSNNTNLTEHTSDELNGTINSQCYLSILTGGGGGGGEWSGKG